MVWARSWNNQMIKLDKIKKIQVLRKYEIVANELRQLMLDGVFEVGSLLPNEQELSKQLGIGRSTVREALKLLEAWGLIRGDGPRGQNEICGVPLQGFANSLQMIMDFAEISIVEVIEIRLVLEPFAAYCAAQNITKEKVEWLESCLKTEEDMASDPEGHSERNFNLHLTIAKASGNKLLAFLIEALKNVLIQQDKEVIVTDELRAKVHSEHIKIVKSICQGRGEEARQLVHDHLSFAFERLREKTSTAFIQTSSPHLTK